MYFHYHYIYIYSLCISLFLAHHHLKDLVKVINNSNLQILFYNVAYEATSIIIYCKEPLEVGFMDNPLPSKYFVTHHPTQHSRMSNMRTIVT